MDEQQIRKWLGLPDSETRPLKRAIIDGMKDTVNPEPGCDDGVYIDAFADFLAVAGPPSADRLDEVPE